MQNRDEIIVSARVLKNYLTMGTSIGETLRDLGEIQPKYAKQWNAMASKCESGARLADQLRIEKMWPDSMIAAVSAGEESSAIEMVLDRIVTFNMEMHKIMKMIRGKLIGPLIFVFAGIAIFIGFMTFVLPGVSKPLKKARDRQGLIHVSDVFVDIYQHHLIEVMVGAGIFVAALIFIFKSQPVKTALFAMIDKVPVLGNGLREIYLGFWLQFMAILDAAGDIAYAEMVSIASAIVPPLYRPAMMMVVKDADGGQGLAYAVNDKRWAKDDPRHRWPKMFKGVLKQSATLGQIKGAFEEASRPMVEEGVIKIEKILTFFNLIAMAVAGGGILTPLGGMMLVQLDVVNKMR